MKLVMKFGGTSISDASRILQVSKIVRKYHRLGYKVVVVTSAIAGVTDALITLANRAVRGEWQDVLRVIEGLREKHCEIVEVIQSKSLKQESLRHIESLINDLENFLKGISIVREATPRARDYILSFGEQLSTKIVALKLEDIGVPAEYLTGWDAGIVTNDSFGSAKPIMSITEKRVRERVEPLLLQGIVPVITGYIASTVDGYTTTLGRGGSDYTASILGAALGADEIWIWTDVSGIMTADPKIEPGAKTISKLSYDEAAELAYFGAKVLQPYMLKPAKERGVPVRVKNTFNPSEEGTLITGSEEVEAQREIVKAIGINNNMSILTVRELDVHSLKEIMALLKSLIERDVDIILLSQSFPKGSLSLVIPRDKTSETLGKINSLGKFRVECEEDVSLIAVVGLGMKGTPGVAARVFQAVAERGINIRAIAQGPSELNISFIVKRSDGEEAVRAIHRKFNLGD